MQLKRGLGRGIESLIPPPIAVEEKGQGLGVNMVPIDSIIPNRLQPRSVFDEEKIRELADSIREEGILQPLLVSPAERGRYELIAGERRLRAARMAGLGEVPVVIRKADEEGLLALSIVENIQREDLNPLEEAKAYSELAEQFGFTQEDIAKKVGKSRVAVANSLRLLGLPIVIQEDVAGGRYSAGHARAILAVEGLHERLKLRERILREMPTVRDVEKMVQSHRNGGRGPRHRRMALSSQVADLIERMKRALGTKVTIQPSGRGGRLIIEYYSPQELDKIYRRIIG